MADNQLFVVSRARILGIMCKAMSIVLQVFGAVFMILLLLSFTSLPFWGYYWLGTSKSGVRAKPAYIVLLGGGGMPSESNLMRAYFVAKAATSYPDSRVVISIPGDTSDSGSAARLIANSLIVSGVSSNRILYENIGTNTRMQAICLQTISSGELCKQPILLVTSPEHTRRAVLVFRKAGFSQVDALPAFENALEADLVFDDDKLGGRKIPLPDIGENLAVRYQFWNHLKYEILIARELIALSYYFVKGWI